MVRTKSGTATKATCPATTCASRGATPRRRSPAFLPASPRSPRGTRSRHETTTSTSRSRARAVVSEAEARPHGAALSREAASPALSEVVEVLTPPARASAPPPAPPSPRRRPAAAPPPPPPLFDAEALADAALAEVPPRRRLEHRCHEQAMLRALESKPTSRDGGPAAPEFAQVRAAEHSAELCIPQLAKALAGRGRASPAPVAAAAAEATRLRGALGAVLLEESMECQVCMATRQGYRAGLMWPAPAHCVTRARMSRIVKRRSRVPYTVQSRDACLSALGSGVRVMTSFAGNKMEERGVLRVLAVFRGP